MMEPHQCTASELCTIGINENAQHQRPSKQSFPLSQRRKMIKAVKLKVIHPKPFHGELIKKFKKATSSCPVKHSLNDAVRVEVEWGQEPSQL